MTELMCRLSARSLEGMLLPPIAYLDIHQDEEEIGVSVRDVGDWVVLDGVISTTYTEFLRKRAMAITAGSKRFVTASLFSIFSEYL